MVHLTAVQRKRTREGVASPLGFGIGQGSTLRSLAVYTAGLRLLYRSEMRLPYPVPEPIHTAAATAAVLARTAHLRRKQL